MCLIFCIKEEETPCNNIIINVTNRSSRVIEVVVFHEKLIVKRQKYSSGGSHFVNHQNTAHMRFVLACGQDLALIINRLIPAESSRITPCWSIEFRSLKGNAFLILNIHLAKLVVNLKLCSQRVTKYCKFRNY